MHIDIALIDRPTTIRSTRCKLNDLQHSKMTLPTVLVVLSCLFAAVHPRPNSIRAADDSPATNFNNASNTGIPYWSQSGGLLSGSYFGVPGINRTFDYVVVGGGTAGLTIASRLSGTGGYSVAVIEAGGLYELDNGNLSQVPSSAAYWIEPVPLTRNPLIDWYQFTTPQTALDNRSLHYASGKTLGGGSARNSLWYQRSATGAYQLWADRVDDDSYTFANMNQYFTQTVSLNSPDNATRPQNSSVLVDAAMFASGLLQVSYPAWVNPVSSFFSSAWSALGLSAATGFTNGDLEGWSYMGCTMSEEQVRSSSQCTFLQDALTNGHDLTVYKSTVAKRILFDESKTATGVEVESGGWTYSVSAGKEVIVSSGTLLMVSGIGPNETLASQGIEVISELAGVGQNMMDHVSLGTVNAVNLITHSRLVSDPAFAMQSMVEFNQNRTGMMTNAGADIMAFQRFEEGVLSNSTYSDLLALYPSDWPHLELVGIDANILSQSTDTRDYATSMGILVAPFSRGNVTINSTSTLINPIVDPNWLLDPRDQEIAIAAFKRTRQVFATSPLQNIILGDEFFPGSNITSDADILAAIRASASTVSHAAGTCGMGQESDPMAVIDSRCRVFGVQGLRVVDASAFPFLPPGHPQGTVYALAAKIADDILNGS